MAFNIERNNEIYRLGNELVTLKNKVIETVFTIGELRHKQYYENNEREMIECVVADYELFIADLEKEMAIAKSRVNIIRADREAR